MVKDLQSTQWSQCSAALSSIQSLLRLGKRSKSSQKVESVTAQSFEEYNRRTGESSPEPHCMACWWALGCTTARSKARKQLSLQSQTGENGSMEGICYLVFLPLCNGTGLTSPVFVMPHVHLHSNSNFGLVLSMPKLQVMAFGFFLRNNQHTKNWQEELTAARCHEEWWICPGTEHKGKDIKA